MPKYHFSMKYFSDILHYVYISLAYFFDLTQYNPWKFKLIAFIQNIFSVQYLYICFNLQWHIWRRWEDSERKNFPGNQLIYIRVVKLYRQKSVSVPTILYYIQYTLFWRGKVWNFWPCLTFLNTSLYLYTL